MVLKVLIQVLEWATIVINKKMKLTYFFLIGSFLCLFNNARGQVIDNKVIGNLITKNVATGGKVDPKKIFIFSIFLSVNNQGKIDSVFFSKIREPWILENEIRTKPILSYFLKTEPFVFKQHKNSIIIFPVLLRDFEEIQATYLSELALDFSSLFDVGDTFRQRQIIIGKPLTVRYTVDY